MRKLIASEFVTLDGVMESPGHDPQNESKSAWALQYAGEDQQRFKIDEAFACDAMLLGRVTYEVFASFWPTAPNDDGFADRMNGMTKFVVSRSLQSPAWQNTVVIRDPAEEIPKLKAEPGGDIVLYGSCDLFNWLHKHGFVDEYRLMIFPVVLGGGRRLFEGSGDTNHLRLVDTLTFDSGVSVLTYEPTDRIPMSKYFEEFTWTREQIQSWDAAQNADRVLATVLFTDIVGSTTKAAEVGDQQWRKMLDRHDEAARAGVERFRGRFVKSTGDGILATFDAPTRALRCAFQLNDAMSDIGLAIRSAVHTGEIEIRDEDVGGIGVHIAARALSKAGGGDVVVTRTVHDLATGTDLVFKSLGSVSLRGVPGEWELFSVSIS